MSDGDWLHVFFLKIMFLNEDDLHCIAERAT